MTILRKLSGVGFFKPLAVQHAALAGLYTSQGCYFDFVIVPK